MPPEPVSPAVAADAPAITAVQFEELIRGAAERRIAYAFRVEELVRGACRIRLHFDEGQLRHGGTIAGPVMFTLADAVLYAMAMSVAGFEPLVVTTDLNLHFLRKPAPADLIGVGRLLKDQGRLLMGDVQIFSDGDDRPVAHATGTYAVPGR